VSTSQVDFGKILPPPPVPHSSQQARDLEAVLRAQAGRSQEQADRAVKDNAPSVERIVDGILGNNFVESRLPKFMAFYKRVTEDTRALFLPTKSLWNRPRPFSISNQVNAIGELLPTASYPSGHATRGWLTAILLANMVPEQSAELFQRGREYGDNRVVAGVHFPTDIEAGRLGASAIATALMQNDAFHRDFNDAKAELREVLGLPM